MVNIGFKSKSFFEQIPNYAYGDDDWIVRVRPLDWRTAMYANAHARMFLGFSTKRGFVDATEYVDHPGDIAIFARLHLALLNQGALQSHQFSLNSSQVDQVINGQLLGQQTIDDFLEIQ